MDDRSERLVAIEVAVLRVEVREGQRQDLYPADKHSAGYQVPDGQLSQGQK